MFVFTKNFKSPWQRTPSSWKRTPWGKKNFVNDLIHLYEKHSGKQLKKSGRAWVGNCVFHEDNKPSFSLYEDTQTAHCFGCGWNGTFYWLIKSLKEL